MDLRKIMVTHSSLEDLTNNEIDILKVPSREALVLFLFSKGRKMPGLLLKSPRGEKDAKKIVQEANNLKKLKECLNGWEYEETIPRLFDMTSDGKNTYLVMGVLKGILMAHYLRCPVKKAFTRENLLIQSVLNWLIQFHKKTWQTKVTVNRYIQDYLSPLIEKNIDRMTPHLENVWESATERLNKMGNESIPITLCHTDFNPYNILVDAGEISGVIDWTDLREDIPLIDFFNFFTMLICSLPYRDYSKIKDRFKTFYLSNQFKQIRRVYFEYLKYFNKELNIPKEITSAFYQIYLILMALKWERGTDSHSRWEDVVQAYTQKMGGQFSDDDS